MKKSITYPQSELYERMRSIVRSCDKIQNYLVMFSQQLDGEGRTNMSSRDCLEADNQLKEIIAVVKEISDAETVENFISFEEQKIRLEKFMNQDIY